MMTYYCVADVTPTPTPATTGGAQVGAYGQCGGIGYSGPTSCVAGTTCTYQNDYDYQCIPNSTTYTPTATATSYVSHDSTQASGDVANGWYQQTLGGTRYRFSCPGGTSYSALDGGCVANGTTSGSIRDTAAVADSGVSYTATPTPTSTPVITANCYELADSTPIPLKPNMITIIKPSVALLGHVKRVSVHLNFSTSTNLSGVKSALLIDAVGDVANLWATGGLCATRSYFAGGNIDTDARVSIESPSACTDGVGSAGYTQSYLPYDDFQSVGILGSYASPGATAKKMTAVPWQLRLVTDPSTSGYLINGQLCITTDSVQPQPTPGPTPHP